MALQFCDEEITDESIQVLIGESYKNNFEFIATSSVERRHGIPKAL